MMQLEEELECFQSILHVDKLRRLAGIDGRHIVGTMWDADGRRVRVWDLLRSIADVMENG